MVAVYPLLPLTPALYPEYRGEGENFSLCPLRPKP